MYVNTACRSGCLGHRCVVVLLVGCCCGVVRYFRRWLVCWFVLLLLWLVFVCVGWVGGWVVGGSLVGRSIDWSAGEIVWFCLVSISLACLVAWLLDRSLSVATDQLCAGLVSLVSNKP